MDKWSVGHLGLTDHGSTRRAREFPIRSVVIADPDAGDRLTQIRSAVTDHNVQIQMAARALLRRQLMLAKQQGHELCVLLLLGGREEMRPGATAP
jgi:hypothetical protein